MRFRYLAFAGVLPLASFAQGPGVNFFDPEGPAPALLSQTGVYSDIAAKKPDTAMNYFEVNAALWSDGAAKHRWIILPPGKRVTYVDSVDYFDYPNKTIFVKNFYLDTVLDDATTRRYWETRLLVNKETPEGYDHWYGFSYRWRADGSNADYVGLSGQDTVANYYPRGITRPLSYKKWQFPSSGACQMCHNVGTTNDLGAPITARGVLGFFPAQLKRASSLSPGKNQVDALFDSGVFAGTPPTDSMKRVRFKGIGEPLPPVGDENRFRVIDTMARSYIAANCSGCHGTRTMAVVGGVAPQELNYDYFRLRPVIEFGRAYRGSLNLDRVDEDTTGYLQDGRHKYRMSVRRAGLDMTPGMPWDMSFPATAPDPIVIINAGFPSMSTALYRQLALRRPPWRDSLTARDDGRPAWMFVNPWGSQAWRNDLASHGMTLKEVITFNADGLPMPLIGSHIPDTAGMKILGEWAKTYRTLIRIDGQDSVVTLRDGRVLRFAAEGARIQNRMLIVPEGWTGKAVMFGMNGKAQVLSAAGRNRYALPHATPSGVYFFKVGSRSFRASVMR
jgi:hypothetical protein